MKPTVDAAIAETAAVIEATTREVAATAAVATTKAIEAVVESRTATVGVETAAATERTVEDINLVSHCPVHPSKRGSRLLHTETARTDSQEWS